MTYVQGDNGIVIPFSTSLDLTGATVYVTIKKSGVITEKTATVLDVTNGTCQFTLLSTDITRFGWYLYQWSAYYGDGRILSDAPIRFYVEKKLAGIGYTPAVSVPNDVTGLSASTISSATLTLAWMASAGATSYDVYQGSTLLGNTTSTSFSVAGLNASTTYTFEIIAKNSSGSAPGTGSGATISVTTLAPPVLAPADVTGLVASNIGATSLILEWTSSSGATNYDVYNGNILLGNTTSATYSVSGLSPSTAYTFEIVAKNNIGSAPGTGAGATVNVTTTVPPVTAPNDVTNLSTSAITATSLTLSWTASSGATSYDVYNGSILLGNTQSTSYNVSALSPATTYKFGVIAKNAVGAAPGTGNGANVSVTTAANPANTTAIVGNATVGIATVA